MLLKTGSEEGIYYCELDLDEIREYQKNAIWGANFRHPNAYAEFVKEGTNKKFSPEKIYKATIYMFGGLLIHAEALKRNKKKYWANFSASVDESTVVNAEKTKETVRKFNFRHKNFWYEVNESTGKKLACDHINLLEGAGIKACA